MSLPGAQDYLDAYVTSLATTAEPDEFADVTLALMQPSTWKAHSGALHATAVRVANEAQRAELEAKIKHQQITSRPTQ